MPLVIALMVPNMVEIEIALLPADTDVPLFCATMPVAPELMITPDVVLMFNAPKVEIAWMPFDVVPVTVAPPPTAILRGPVPAMRALIPTVLPDTLPKSTMSVEPVAEFVTMPAPPDEERLPA